MARRTGLLIALVAALAGAFGCGGGAPVEPPTGVLLIVVDTLRADHLGAYGYTRATSPHIDALAARGIRYDRATSQAPWTTPSVGSLLTSLHPARLGIAGIEDVLPDDALLVSEILRERGFATGAVVSHKFVSSRWNFDQGFDSFDENAVLGHDGVSSARVSDAAIDFLERRAGEPFFLLLHYFDPHFAYVEHAGFEFSREGAYAGPVRPGVEFGSLLKLRRSGGLDADDVRELERLYDSEIAFTDHHIGRVLDALGRLGIAGSTAVILTADHGEEFMDHGRLGHSKTLYEELVRVPLVVSAPGLAPGVDDRRVALVDVMPTILAWLGIPAPDGLDGIPLARAADDRSVFTATTRPIPRAAVVGPRWKLVRPGARGAPELFDLERDPRERRDLAGEASDERSRLEARLDAFERELEPRAPESLELSGEEREALRALGYGGPGSD